MMRMTSVLAAALVLGACDSGTLGTSRGTDSGDSQMQVSVRGDDAQTTSQSLQSADGGAPSFNHTDAQGTVTFQARVYVQSTTSGWVEITNGVAGQGTVDASGHGQALAFASSRLEAGSYNRVRVVFEDVEANLSTGIQIGTGLLTGSVSVNLEGDGQVVVEREVTVTATDGATSQVLINLNSGAWLSTTNVATRTVNEAAFRTAVQVTAQ